MINVTYNHPAVMALLCPTKGIFWLYILLPISVLNRCNLGYIQSSSITRHSTKIVREFKLKIRKISDSIYLLWKACGHFPSSANFYLHPLRNGLITKSYVPRGIECGDRSKSYWELNLDQCQFYNIQFRLKICVKNISGSTLKYNGMFNKQRLMLTYSL